MKKIFILLVCTTLLFGVHAYKKEKEFKNSDSSTFKGQLRGDEWFSWVQTKEGYTAKYNGSSQNYEYMILSNEEKLLYSNVKVSDSTTRGVLPSEIQIISPQKLGKLWQSAWQKRYER